MRRNKDIEKLTEKAKTIKFPRFDSELGHFRAKLRDLVADNFGYSAGKEMDYDEDSGVYFWSVIDFIGKIGDTAIKASRTYEINPLFSISQEFARVAEEQKQYADEKLKIAKVILAAGGKV